MAESYQTDEREPVNEESFVILNKKEDPLDEFTIDTTATRLGVYHDLKISDQFSPGEQDHTIQRPCTAQLPCIIDENLDKEDSFVIISESCWDTSKQPESSGHVSKDSAELKESESSFDHVQNKRGIASFSKDFVQHKVQDTDEVLIEKEINTNVEYQERKDFVKDHEGGSYPKPPDNSLTILQRTDKIRTTGDKDFKVMTNPSSKIGTKTSQIDEPSLQNTFENIENYHSADNKRTQPNDLQTVVKSVTIPIQKIETDDNTENSSNNPQNTTEDSDQNENNHSSMSSGPGIKPVFSSSGAELVANKKANIETDTTTTIAYQASKGVNDASINSFRSSNRGSFYVIKSEENSIGFQDGPKSTIEASNVDIKDNPFENESDLIKPPKGLSSLPGSNKGDVEKTLSQNRFVDPRETNEKSFADIDRGVPITEDKNPVERQPLLSGNETPNQREQKSGVVCDGHRTLIERKESIERVTQSENVIDLPGLDKDIMILNNESNVVQGTFGEIRLIKVGKFWLISLNGAKAKLPTTINKDVTLRFEIFENIPMLVTDSQCYIIKILGKFLSLEEKTFHFSTQQTVRQDIEFKGLPIMESSSDGNEIHESAKAQQNTCRSSSPDVEVADSNSKSQMDSGIGGTGEEKANSSQSSATTDKIRAEATASSGLSNEESFETEIRDGPAEKEETEGKENIIKTQEMKGHHFARENAETYVTNDSSCTVKVDEVTKEIQLKRVDGVFCLEVDGHVFAVPQHIRPDEKIRLERKECKTLLFSGGLCFEVKIEKNRIILLGEQYKHELISMKMTPTDTKKETEESGDKIGKDPIKEENEANDMDVKAYQKANRNDLDERKNDSQGFENDTSIVILDETSMSVCGSFGEIKLIKVGKFWLVSVNGSKLKLPSSINKDQTLRFEAENNKVLLLSDAVCYEVKLNTKTLTLEENNVYLSKSRVRSENKDKNSSSTEKSHNVQQENEDEMTNYSNRLEEKEVIIDPLVDDLSTQMRQMSIDDSRANNSTDNESRQKHRECVEEGGISAKSSGSNHGNVVAVKTVSDQRKNITVPPASISVSETITRRVVLPNNLPWKKLIEKFPIEQDITKTFHLNTAYCLSDGVNVCLQITGKVENVRAAEDYIEKDVIKMIVKKEIHLRLQVVDVFEKTLICRILEGQLPDCMLLHFENNKLSIVCFGDESCESYVNLICTTIVEKTVSLTGVWRNEKKINALIEELQQTEKGVYISLEQTGTRLIVTGLKTEVEDLFRQINKLMTAVVTTIDHKDPSTTLKMKEHILTPCDKWLQLAKRFELCKVLGSKDKSVIVEFKETQTKSDTVCKCIIKGYTENDVEEVYELFLDKYVRKLRTETAAPRIKRTDILHKTKLCSLMVQRYPDVLLLPDIAGLVLLTFNETVDLLSLSSNIRKELTDNKILLQGPWKELDQAQKMVEEIGMKYDDIDIEIDKTDLSLYIVGIRDDVNAATNHIVQKMADKNTISKTVSFGNENTLDIVEKDVSFIQEMKQKYAVDVLYRENCLQVRGEQSFVLRCEQELQEYFNNVLTEEMLVTKDQMEKIQPILPNVGVENHVNFECRLRPMGTKEASSYFKDDSNDRKSFTFPNGHKLIILDQQSGNKNDGSNVIVNMGETSFGLEGHTRHNDQGLIRIQFNLPVWSDGAMRRTKRFIRKILTEVGQDNESVIDFKFPALDSWSTDDIVFCFLESIYKHCIEVKKGTNPQFVILSPLVTEFEYFVGCCRIQMKKLVNALDDEKFRAQNGLQITVVEGKLNEFKADILVNTAAADLDLKQGAVSSALLHTAGPEMQNEVRRNYRRPLHPGEIAITKGYNLQCRHVFHGALSVYEERRRDALREQYRSFLRNSLTKATEYHARSIAFPAIGTGNLRYPISFVTTEMFATVEEFKQETTLQHVFFVVFPGDQQAVQAFKKQDQKQSRQKEKSTVQLQSETNGNSKMVEIKVTGHQDNVRKALNLITDEQKKIKPPEDNNLKPMTYADAIKLPNQPVTESLSLPSVIRHSFSCETDEGLRVRVYASDILCLPVGSIVNLTDSNLDNNTGLTSLIADSAGDVLKRDCRDHIRHNGRMGIGKVVKTSAGNLKYRCVIHTLWPQWIEYKPYTEEKIKLYQNDLQKAIISTLNLAEREGLSAIAIPISFENQKAPCELSVMQFVKAIKGFSGSKSKHNRCLKEIHFVDVNSKNAVLIKQGFTEMLINNNPCPWNWRVYVKQQDGAIANVPQPEQSDAKDEFNKLPYCMENRDGLTCKITRTRIVDITFGDLLRSNKSDAVVCSEDPSGAAAGVVAKLLLKRGGLSYQQEKKREYQMSTFKIGDICITNGGDSGFRHIIHAIMPHRMTFPKNAEKQWEDALSNMINKIFETIEERKYKTVAMSLLGSGAGSSDPRQCAKILLDSFNYSCTKYPDSILYLDVVNYDINRHKVVVSVFKEAIEQSRKYTNQTISEPKEKWIRPKHKTAGGRVVGDQPDGSMTINLMAVPKLPGYTCRTIKITYKFKNGKQGKNHPYQGKVYKATEKEAYLPDIKEGREVCTLLKLAFERRLVFTIGTSKTTREGEIKWNGIHHKTFTNPHTMFGYPDHGYFDRVKRDLANKGVTNTDPDFDGYFLETLNRGYLRSFPVTISVPKIGMAVSSV